MADENCDLELTVLNDVIRALSHASLDDTQKRRIIQYVSARCIKPEPQWNSAQAGLINQAQYYKG